MHDGSKWYNSTDRYESWVREEEVQEKVARVGYLDDVSSDDGTPPPTVTQMTKEEHIAAMDKALEEAWVNPERLNDGHSSVAGAGSNCFDIYMRNKKFELQRTKDFEKQNREERQLKKRIRKIERENDRIEAKRAKKRRKRQKAKEKKKQLSEDGNKSKVQPETEKEPEVPDVVPLVAEPVAWAEKISDEVELSIKRPNLEVKKKLEKDFEEAETSKERKHKWKPPAKKSLSVKDKLAALLGNPGTAI